MSRPLLLALALGAAACSPQDMGVPDAGMTPDRPCPPSTVLSAQNVCEPVLPAAPCGASERPVWGSTTCAAVGVGTCAPPLAADPSGWGCTAALPSTACAGATQETLGSTDCAPIGDCTAPFPPPEATLFVDDDTTQPDATHFQTLAAALAAASAGATIAVEAGHYPAPLTLSKPVSLVGRCAQQVVLNGADSSAGLKVSAAVSVRGVTVTGFHWGAVVLSGALTLSESVVEANHEIGLGAQGGALTATDVVVRGTLPNAAGDYGIGVAAGAGSHVTLTRVTVIGSREAGVDVSDPGSAAELHEVIVTGTVAGSDGQADALRAETGTTLTVASSLVSENFDTAVTAIGSTVHLSDSILRNTTGNATAQGEGIQANSKATLTVEGCTISGNRTVGIAVLDGATGTVSSSVIEGTVHGVKDSIAVLADNGSTLTLTDSALVGNEGQSLTASRLSVATITRVLIQGELASGLTDDYDRALEVATQSLATVDDSALVDNVGIGVIAIEAAQNAAPARAVLTHVVVSGTLPTAASKGGEAVIAQSGWVQLTECGLVSSAQVSALAINSGALLDVERTLVSGTTQSQGMFGYGVFGASGTSLLLTDTEIAQSAGVGVALAGGSGIVSGGGISNNAIGVAVYSGTTLRISSAAGDMPNGSELVVSSATVFSGDTTRVGSGDYPLPPAFTLPPPPSP